MKTRRVPLAIPLLLILCLLPQPASAWTSKSQFTIGRLAAQIAPPDLRRQIEKHKHQYISGLKAPFSDGNPGAHMKNGNGSGELDRVIVQQVDWTVAAIRAHHPFPEIVERLGVIAHYVADAANPLNAQEDSRERAYAADYLRYMQSAQGRFSVVFYAPEHALDSSAGVQRLIDASLTRGRRYYPLIAHEYERIGRVAGVELFDDRSTAFGIAALSFNHAVSDVAMVLRYVWLRAGGADDRTGLLNSHLLPPSAEPASR